MLHGQLGGRHREQVLRLESLDEFAQTQLVKVLVVLIRI
jgi:hypothetical protein